MNRVAICVGIAVLVLGAGRARTAAPPRTFHSVKERRLSLSDASELVELATRHQPMATRSQRMVEARVAYWKLYSAKQVLRCCEDDLGLKAEWVKVTQAKHDAGRATAPELFMSRGRLRMARSEQSLALGRLEKQESDFRRLLDLPAGDGTRLAASDPPTEVSYEPDWRAARSEALLTHPSLTEPTVRLLTCLGEWAEEWVTLSLRRQKTSVSQETRTRLSRAAEELRRQESQVVIHLGWCYRKLAINYAQVRTSRQLRESSFDDLQACQGQYEGGGCPLASLLEAQTRHLRAVMEARHAVAEYNGAIACFEYARGTMR